jgi:hypothetical protein
MPSPSWILLSWSGFAATLAAALVGVAVGAGAPRAWSLAPRAPTTSSALRATVVTGLVAYPLLYGLVFELLGRADLLIGLMAGSLHAIIAFFLARPRAHPATAMRSAAAHLVYVTVLAFVYITA